MKKEIYLIRHGETDYNRYGMVQGSGIDSSLNETGQRQAALFFGAYGETELNRVYVSALKRTRESVISFSEAGVPTEQHAGLNEICWGKHEGQFTTTLDKEYYSWLINEWKSGNTDVPIRGGESPEEVALRQQPVIDLILSRKEEERILVCMHGRAMRVFLCRLLNIPLQEMDRFAHGNLCLYILRMNENGKFEIVKENCTMHLEQMEKVLV